MTTQVSSKVNNAMAKTKYAKERFNVTGERRELWWDAYRETMRATRAIIEGMSQLTSSQCLKWAKNPVNVLIMMMKSDVPAAFEGATL